MRKGKTHISKHDRHLTETYCGRGGNVVERWYAIQQIEDEDHAPARFCKECVAFLMLDRGTGIKCGKRGCRKRTDRNQKAVSFCSREQVGGTGYCGFHQPGKKEKS